MPIQVKNILLAEFIRAEPFSKASLLGFYGMLPEVKIRVGNMQLPVTLGILVMGHGTLGTYPLQLLMNGPDGMNVFTGQTTVPVTEEGLITVLFNIAGITFKEGGSYSMKVFVGRDEIYSAPLTITEDKSLMQLANATAV